MSFKRCFFVLFFCAIAGFAGLLSAEVVTEVKPDGTLVLENGRQVSLAGVAFDTEGVSVLRVLAQKQDLRFREDSSLTVQGFPSVYAYLRAKFFKFSALDAGGAREEEIMLNAFLIQHGAARVIEASAFSEKDRFLKIQETAKKKGEGIWSYEKP